MKHAVVAGFGHGQNGRLDFKLLRVVQTDEVLDYGRVVVEEVHLTLFTLVGHVYQEVMQLLALQQNVLLLVDAASIETEAVLRQVHGAEFGREDELVVEKVIGAVQL